MAKAIFSDKAPDAAGPYSHAYEAGGLVITSGQLGIDPETGMLVDGAEAQARQAFQNLSSVLSAAGSSMEKVVKVTVFGSKLEDFATLNKVYPEFFAEPFPARSGMEVSRLPLGAIFEIEVIAEK